MYIHVYMFGWIADKIWGLALKTRQGEDKGD